MKVYICADIEGIAGVVTPQQCQAGNPEYERARVLMTEEVNAAIAGARDAGATEILVNDAHGPMTNLLPDRVDRMARLIQGKPKPFGMFAGLTRDFDVVFCVGFHAPASDFGVLAHTTSSAAFRSVRIGDTAVSEAALYGAYAAELGVPVTLISGDDACAAHCKGFFPRAERVAVKTALGNRSAAALHPEAAREAIAAAAKRAVFRQAEVAPVVPPSDTLTLDMIGAAQADLVATIPTASRLDATRVALPIASVADAVRWVNVAAALAASLR